MLSLEHHITLTKEVIESPNLCDRFSDDDLTAIGQKVWNDYDMDKQSRTEWETQVESAMDLALQIQKPKNTPWQGCSNINFPLLTIAVLQFHARAYPAIIQGNDVVQYRVTTADQEGLLRQRANRIGRYMSYQVMEEDTDWEKQHNQLLINVAVVGTAFKKTYHNSLKAHNVSEFVSAKDLVVNYWAKSIEDNTRKTHVYPMSRNDIHERVLSGTFRDILDAEWYVAAQPITYSASQAQHDNRTGQRPPVNDSDSPLLLLEQHCSLDLDGDGYAEPYIVTIDAESHHPLRIVTRFDRLEDISRVQTGKRKGQIIKIDPMEYFTKYGFIPSPDGSIYDRGFGTLLYPLNNAVNTIMNQLVDAGTLSVTSGGFLGRGAKIRGGDYSFKPFEWKRVDSTGEDLHKSMVPLPVREPSAVLLNLLTLIINYTNRISGATDMMVGENPGQNTPAETSRSMIEQGTKIYNAIFKSIWASMKEEFRKLYVLNSIYMPIEQSFGIDGMVALREDFLGDPRAVAPVADPNIMSDEQNMRQAVTLKQAAMTSPGYDKDAVERRYLQALRIDDIDQIYPGIEKAPPPPDPKVQVEQMKLQAKQQAQQQSAATSLAQLEEEKRLNDAKIMDLHAKAIRTMTEASDGNLKTKLSALETMLNALATHGDRLTNQIAQAKGASNESGSQSAASPADISANPIPGMEASPDDQAILPNDLPMEGSPAQ